MGRAGEVAGARREWEKRERERSGRHAERASDWAGAKQTGRGRKEERRGGATGPLGRPSQEEKEEKG